MYHFSEPTNLYAVYTVDVKGTQQHASNTGPITTGVSVKKFSWV